MKILSITATILVLIASGLALSISAVSSNPEDQQDPGRKDRNSRRAFYTAPPVIPHEVTQRDNAECLECHEGVKEEGQWETLPVPHGKFANCLQCHVTAEPSDGSQASAEFESNWVGLEEPGKIERANAQAPPVIPHRVLMRKNCAACHHADSNYEFIKAPHPERANCRQCHLVDRKREF